MFGASSYCGGNNCTKTVIAKNPVATQCAFGPTGVGLCRTGYTVTTQTNGGYCDYGNGGSPSTPMPDGEPNDNPCPSGHGVASAANGFLRCLPQGTGTSEGGSSGGDKTEVKPPNGGPPVVTEDKKTETKTYTTCVESGSCTTTTVTTITNNQTGEKTTSTKESTTSKSEFCAKNPKDNACTGAGEVQPDGSIGDGSAGNCDPKVEMCGSPGTGDLYEKKDKTFTTVLQSFSNDFKATPAVSAMTGFFTVNLAAGGCPNWQTTVDYLNVTINLSQYFCTSTATTMMNVAGAVLMIIAAFVGFRWAIL